MFTDAAHCYNVYILSLQGVARFYKRNKKHVITTQTVSVKDCKFLSCFENSKYNTTLDARDFSSAVSEVYVGLWPTPKISTAREKNLWYPG